MISLPSTSVRSNSLKNWAVARERIEQNETNQYTSGVKFGPLERQSVHSSRKDSFKSPIGRAAPSRETTGYWISCWEPGSGTEPSEQCGRRLRMLAQHLFRVDLHDYGRISLDRRRTP